MKYLVLKSFATLSRSLSEGEIVDFGDDALGNAFEKAGLVKSVEEGQSTEAPAEPKEKKKKK